MSAVKPMSATPEVIDARLEGQRQRIFQVQGIIGTAARAAHSASVGQLGEDEWAQFASDLWMALEHVHKLLESIAGQLDVAVMLGESVPRQEAQS
jgi:hypothetical protein